MTPTEQGVALLKGGRFHEALQVFGAALREQPLAVDPRVGLSQACQGMGDGWAAAAWLSDACRVAPERVELWIELVRLITGQQREAELEPLLRAALASHPDDVQLLLAQADLCIRKSLFAKGVEVHAKLYTLHPGNPAIALHYGHCLENTDQVEQAAQRYREALAASPDFLEAHVNLSGVLWRLEDFDGALKHARRALELGPNHPYAVRILGTAMLNLCQLDEAQSYLRRALQLQPGFKLAEVDLAFTLLAAGKLKEGWEMYAHRWQYLDQLKRPVFYQAEFEWKGLAQSLRGKRIAVYAEQGLGDVIQFIRYAPLLQQQGATVFAMMQRELAPLVQHSMPTVDCATGQRELKVDHHVALLELPMHFGTTLENIPQGIPYLQAPADKVRSWRDKLAAWQGGLRVGLAWSGSRRQVNNNNRAMRLSDLSPLLEMEGVQCFSLQKGDAGPFTDLAPADSRLVDLTGDWQDFTDSAAMLQNLDLVITVDTSLAHLAGALGRPVWVMLGPNADWRWLLEREDSPWYPTMRLFRRVHGELRAVQVERVRQALALRVAQPAGKT